MELKKLDKGIRTLWFIEGAAAFLLLLAALITALALTPGTSAFVPLLIVGIISILLLAFLLLILPILSYRCFSYGYDDKRVYINKGVIFKHRITIPVCQIQNLDIAEGPLMMLFKVSSVIISTAGSMYTVTGIEKQTARDMANELEALLEERIEAMRDE